MAGTTTILLTSIPGLSLPPTKTFSLPNTTTSAELLGHISSFLPDNLDPNARFIITTTNNKQILYSNTETLHDINERSGGNSRNIKNAYPPPPALLTLRLSVPLCGGKGGFGSQLRAAGGRMSSRKKRATQGELNGSNRNLDGRRLRTITEAKNLATYLATFPEMERKEKEERRKRWEQVVEAAERREEEVRRGGGGKKGGKGLSEEWIEEKEDVGERARDAVRRAMMGGDWTDSITTATAGKKGRRDPSASGSGSGGSEGAASDEDSDTEMELDETDMAKLKAEAAAGDADAIWVLENQVQALPQSEGKGKQKQQQMPPSSSSARTFAGFDDDDDEFLSSDDDDETDRPETTMTKGKAK